MTDTPKPSRAEFRVVKGDEVLFYAEGVLPDVKEQAVEEALGHAFNCPVTLQRRRSRKWVTVAEVPQGAESVEFIVPDGVKRRGFASWDKGELQTLARRARAVPRK